MGLIVFILKIILIVLLAVLGLFLLLAGLILLVPIRYEVKGILGDSGEIQVKGTVTYLLSMFKLLFFYEKEQFEMRVFIFGFQKKIQEEPILETPQDDGNKTNLKQEEVHNKEIISEKQEFSNKKKQTVEEESGISESMAKKSDASEMDEWKETNNKSEKDKKRKIRKKKTKQEKRRPDFLSIKLQLTDEHNKSVVKKICLEFLYLLRHFKFRKIII